MSIIKASDPTNNPADPIKYEQCLITNKVTPNSTARAAAEAERQQMAQADQAAQQKAADDKRKSDFERAIITDVSTARTNYFNKCFTEFPPAICSNWPLDEALNNDLVQHGTRLEFRTQPGAFFWAAIPGTSTFVCTISFGDYNIQAQDPATAGCK